jgi:pSer/pThr/pTyr-binding forkhead associated (FHA) protein
VRRRAGGALALNGVLVGDEPAPLLHGDRLEVDGCEVRFADEALLGDTLDFPVSADSDALAPSADLKPKRPAAESSTAGRLLSLVDGREYSVAETLRIGRDASCDIVVPQPVVSRFHAEIRKEPTGYLLIDRSTNGVLVNGHRVWAEVGLARGDMIRIGKEEYRFYAEPLPRPAQANQPGAAAADAKAAPRAAAPLPVLQAGRPSAGLATLEVLNEGPMKGTRLEIHSPVANIGRGSHNDVVVKDESVSESHAKIIRRDDTWFVSDLGSTNGTYVGGVRLMGEQPIGVGTELRFGGVKVLFRPLSGAGKGAEQTRVIVGLNAPEPKRMEQTTAKSTPDSSGRGRDLPIFLLLLLMGLVAYVIYLVTQGSLVTGAIPFPGERP